MPDHLTMSAFRALDRPDQVRELENSVALGIGVFKHHVAHYYMHHDYYVGLCATKCGVDFTEVFNEGTAYWDMLGAIAVKGLPKQVKRQSKQAMLDALLEEQIARSDHDREPLDQVKQRLADLNLPERYALAKLAGEQLSFYRSLTAQEKAFLWHAPEKIGLGVFQHYSAHYGRKDDFYYAFCTTLDGFDFNLAFRDGRAFADMERALKGGA